jgi:hypothetical protein
MKTQYQMQLQTRLNEAERAAHVPTPTLVLFDEVQGGKLIVGSFHGYLVDPWDPYEFAAVLARAEASYSSAIANHNAMAREVRSALVAESIRRAEKEEQTLPIEVQRRRALARKRERVWG